MGITCTDFKILPVSHFKLFMWWKRARHREFILRAACEFLDGRWLAVAAEQYHVVKNMVASHTKYPSHNKQKYIADKFQPKYPPSKLLMILCKCCDGRLACKLTSYSNNSNIIYREISKMCNFGRKKYSAEINKRHCQTASQWWLFSHVRLLPR